MPWAGRMQLTEGTALDHNSSEQMQIVPSKRKMEIVPLKIFRSKREKLNAKKIAELPKRTRAVQDRRKGHQRIQLPNPKLLTAATSTAASPPSQEYNLPGSEPSRRVSPEGSVYEVDDEDVL